MLARTHYEASSGRCVFAFCTKDDNVHTAHSLEWPGFSYLALNRMRMEQKKRIPTKNKTKIIIIKWNAFSPVISNNSERIRPIIAELKKIFPGTNCEIHLTLRRKTFCYFHFSAFFFVCILFLSRVETITCRYTLRDCHSHYITSDNMR